MLAWLIHHMLTLESSMSPVMLSVAQPDGHISARGSAGKIRLEGMLGADGCATGGRVRALAQSRLLREVEPQMTARGGESCVEISLGFYVWPIAVQAWAAAGRHGMP